MPKNRVYPKSVQPGIPRLGIKPHGWITSTFRNVLEIIQRPTVIDDENEYTLVTVKRSRAGIEIRGKQKGKYIKVKSQFYISASDFLISRRQIVHGACGIVPEHLDESIVSNEYLVIHAKNELDQNFLRWYSHSIYFQQTCFHASIGVHVEKMVFKPEWWFNFRIHLPPLHEQKKIAEILSAWDRAIKITNRSITNYELLKKGLMQQFLTGRMRFPEFGKAAWGKGALLVGWKACKLGACFKERKETAPDLSLLAITSDRGVIPRDEVERKDTSNADKSKYKRIASGDIGYNTMRMWQGVSSVSTLEGIVSPAYTICIPKKGHSSSFFGYLFKYPPMIHLFYRLSQGLVSDTLNLKFRHFSQVKANVPSEDEQTHIAALLSTCDRGIELLRRKETALHEQKKGLMQKLLTGEIRVKSEKLKVKS